MIFYIFFFILVLQHVAKSCWFYSLCFCDVLDLMVDSVDHIICSFSALFSSFVQKAR